MLSQKRKRMEFSLERKMEIINAYKVEPNQTKLAKKMSEKWGIDVKRTTVKGILSKTKEIEAAVKEGTPMKRKKLRPPKNLEVDEGVLKWLREAQQQNLPIQGNALKEKAKELARLLEISDFSASDGWLNRFKHRHSLTFRSSQKEPGTVSLQPLFDWREQILQPLINQFSEDDIFSLSKTGLFWRLPPNQAMSFRGEHYNESKRSKEIITLFAGANMSGTEKLPLLAIGRFKKPEAFKNEEFAINYKANPRSWMTANTFENELIEWDKQLGDQGRVILLFLDNFAGYLHLLQLENIRMVFFPPITTSEYKPMHQGIIEKLKRDYKKVLLRQRLDAMDLGKEFSFTLLDALHAVRYSWEQVHQLTIKNSFIKAKFAKSTLQIEPDDIDLLEIWRALPSEEKIYDNKQVELTDFLKADERLGFDEFLSLDDIVSMVVNKDKEQEERDEEEDEVDTIEQKVSFQDAQKASITLRKFMQQESRGLKLMQTCDLIDNEMHEIRKSNNRQKTFLNYLGYH